MLVTTMCLWGLNFTASKYIITHGVSPLAYAAPRYAIAALIFAVLTLALEGSLRMGRRDISILLAVSGVLFLNQVGFIYALHYTTASTVALLFGTLPIFTGLAAWIGGTEHPTKRFAIAAGVSVAGVALVAAGSKGALSGNLKGDALALLGSATWSVYSVVVGPMMQRHSPMRVSVYVLSAAALLLAIAGTGQLRAEHYPSAGLVWVAFAFAVLGPLVITNVLWFTAIKRVGPSRASLFSNLQFFLAAIFGVILLSESITVIQVVGGVAIAAAILLSRGPARVIVE